MNWQVGTDIIDENGMIELNIATENIEDLFEVAGRKLGEGLHKAWWRARVDEDPTVIEKAKLELFALCIDQDIMKAVESTAQRLVQKWLKKHTDDIAKLPEGQQQSYDEVRRLAGEPESTPLNFPLSIEGHQSGQLWEKHLFVDEDEEYKNSFNSWETKILRTELSNDNVVAWLRNPARKPWSLCIPYQFGGEYQGLYPDFIIIRSMEKKIVIDLIDPHSLEFADAPAKAAGFAQYAAKHAHIFGRILLIIIDGDKIQHLDLSDERIRDKVKGVQTHEHLRQLYKDASK